MDRSIWQMYDRPVDCLERNEENWPNHVVTYVQFYFMPSMKFM